MTMAGELFLGQSSGGMDTFKTPALLDDIDRAFILGGLEGAYPWLSQIVYFLPIPSLRKFLGARQRIIQVGALASRVLACQ